MKDKKKEKKDKPNKEKIQIDKALDEIAKAAMRPKDMQFVRPDPINEFWEEDRFCGPPGSMIPLGYAKDLGIPEGPTLFGEPEKKAIVDKEIHDLCMKISRDGIDGNCIEEPRTPKRRGDIDGNRLDGLLIEENWQELYGDHELDEESLNAWTEQIIQAMANRQKK